MRFIKEYYHYNSILYKYLILDKAYTTVIFKLTFYFFRFEIAIRVERETLFIIIIVKVYGT